MHETKRVSSNSQSNIRKSDDELAFFQTVNKMLTDWNTIISAHCWLLFDVHKNKILHQRLKILKLFYDYICLKCMNKTTIYIIKNWEANDIMKDLAPYAAVSFTLGRRSRHPWTGRYKPLTSLLQTNICDCEN